MLWKIIHFAVLPLNNADLNASLDGGNVENWNMGF